MRIRVWLLAFITLLFYSPATYAQSPNFAFPDAKWEPNGDRIAVITSIPNTDGRKSQIVIYDANLQQLTTLVPAGLTQLRNEVEDDPTIMIGHFTWSQDGSRIAAVITSFIGDGSRDHVTVWDTHTGAITNEIIRDFYLPKTAILSPDGKFLSASGIYDLTLDEAIIWPALPSPIIGTTKAWNPVNLDQIVATTHNLVTVFNPFSGEIVQEISIDVSTESFPAYSPDGQKLAILRFDDNFMTYIDILDASNNYEVIRTLQHEPGIRLDTESIFWLNNTEIGTSSHSKIFRWNILTGENSVIAETSNSEDLLVFWRFDGSKILARSVLWDSNAERIFPAGMLILDGHSGEIIARLLNGEDLNLRQLTLNNATTGEQIESLYTGSIVELSADSFLIQAHTTPSTVGSIVFDLNGVQTISNTEPYIISVSSLGSYSLSATPYSEPDGEGQAGSPFTIDFTVVEDCIFSTCLFSANLNPISSGD